MFKAIEQLQEVSKKAHSLSKSSKVISHFKNMRLAYLAIDDETKTCIDISMQTSHQDLLAVLQKKGSQLPKISELAGMMDDELLKQLKDILRASLPLQLSESTHTSLHRKMSNEMLDTGTFKIVDASCANQPSLIRGSHNQRSYRQPQPI